MLGVAMSNNKYQPVRGTKDLFGADLQIVKAIEETFVKCATLYGFNEIRTPIIENLNVFYSAVGELSDIVNKEMYVFEDKGGDKIVLRPEGTAPVVRHIASSGLLHLLPLKYYYIAPMFRYERPQKGRQRQFHQLGIEYLGTNDYTSDVEVILLACDLLKKLNINYTLLLNTVGSAESLISYKHTLTNYYLQHKNQLSEDSLKRLEKNPIRILDSKAECDIAINKNAPSILNSLTPEDLTYYNNVKATLKALNVNFTEDNTLVRGLDYYTHTVFEFVSQDLGAQATVVAGGRYNNLIQQFSNTSASAVGFACGVERLALLTNINKPTTKQIAIISMHNNQNNYAFNVANTVRELGFSCSFVQGSNTANKLKKASASNYLAAIIIGQDEVEKNTLELKDLESFSQQTINFTDLKSVLLFKYANYVV